MDLTFLTGATVNDSLRDHNGSKFRTWDQKHSICTEKVGESWWFPEDCAIHSNLNGIYGNIHWGKLDLGDANRTPKTSEMKIRPADFKRREERRTKRGTMKERV